MRHAKWVSMLLGFGSVASRLDESGFTEDCPFCLMGLFCLRLPKLMRLWPPCVYALFCEVLLDCGDGGLPKMQY
jgi:hypothetical protein